MKKLCATKLMLKISYKNSLRISQFKVTAKITI